MLITLAPVYISTNNQSWSDNDWSYRQEIYIPIDTSSENAKYQPIDTHIKFNNPCWGKNEKEHSVRIVVQDDETLNEIESQIYDINYSYDNYIKDCSLVFLIPEDANGKEKYYVYYGEKEKSGSAYLDHIEIEESYYYYDLIPGYPFESHYYKITENGYSVYAITQGGKLMGGGVAQQITKLKPKSTDVMPKNGELFASFDFMYFYGQNLDEYSGSVDNLISKDIFVDGNLMIKCGIVSESTMGDIRTTVIYKYYYCPTENKRIYAHVKHEVLNKFTVAIGPEVEGTYASFQCGGLESNSVKELNFGEIYPYLHIYTEKDTIVEYWDKQNVRFAKYNNCIMCFHRSPMFLNKMAQAHINKAEWFAKMEEEAGSRFRKDVSMKEKINFKPQYELFDSDFTDCDSGFCGI